ncbi:hypothetical protein M436DRAFT_83279 [Aureobasidium namibiae CBS 147.97]|uniref:Uncharacterized protein n=1 Tax=Aureobasidium namibiae CBS 147.97 TaxID=1043004 RepID=A0A074WPP9_9PEZI
MADFNDVPGMNARIDMAVDMLNEKRYAEAEAATRAVLEHRLSRWQHIYATILLADSMNDWYEAEEQRYKAENMWRNTRSLWPPNRDAEVDRELKELREHLDDLKEDQKADLPEYDDDFHEFMVEMYQKYSRVIKVEGEWEKMLQKRSQEAQERELAEIEEYEAQERAEEKEMKAREQDKLQDEAIEDIRYLFGRTLTK